VTVGVHTCSIDGCLNVLLARSWCSTHYSRWRKNGDPNIATRRRRFVGPLGQDRLREMLSYDPVTGIFTWRVNRQGGVKAGDSAGCIKTSFGRLRYRVITISRRDYQAHRLAFLYMVGKIPLSGIDHRDGDGLNNRWRNLRPATPSQNAANAGVCSTNTSGFKGVTWNKKSQRWQAGIKKDGRSIHLGLFDAPETAHSAYTAKARELFGEFTRSK